MKILFAAVVIAALCHVTSFWISYYIDRRCDAACGGEAIHCAKTASGPKAVCRDGDKLRIVEVSR